MILEASRAKFPVCDCCKDSYRDVVPFYKRFVKTRLIAHIKDDPNWSATEQKMLELGKEILQMRDEIDLSEEEVGRALGVDVGEIKAFDMGFLLEKDYPYPDFEDDYLALVTRTATERGIES